MIAHRPAYGATVMRFSWTGLILAPLPVPLIFSVIGAPMMGPPQEGGIPLLVFLILLIAGCVVSYGTTVFLFLPCLFLLSLWTPVTAFRTCLLGLLLGTLMLVPLTWLIWKGSGPDSGPPTESFLVFFVRWAADPMTAMVPLAGLITAGLYWWLVTQRRGRPAPG
jgi:hypothetical protein